ncbi:MULTISPECIES: XapX domain-containing protein [Paenibacillus]|uniref:XapX domain-containing protein n=1 Tax=Paenibacillus TaxID=44249 RepID=UPI0022B91097|nr:XapX domain-containing protein [Paenibacillus caseinilyticus]MCZ8518159.1 XapX domain-containing protein [Paenibacillus caseinilyticus]
MEAIFSLLAGILVGVLFTFIRLPLPAPVTLAGVLGVAGVYLGGRIVGLFLGK